MSKNASALRADLITLFKTLSRTASVPFVVKDATAAKETRFGGSPWLPDDVLWPEQDGERMSFVCQIEMCHFDGLYGLPREGLMSVFIGAEYEEDGEDSCVMILDTSLPGGVRPAFDCPYYGEEHRVSAWLSREDFPHHEDIDAIVDDRGVQVDNSIFAPMAGEHDEDGAALPIMSQYFSKVRLKSGVLMDEEEALRENAEYHHHCIERVKIGGWPFWMQGNETPNDKTGNPMAPVLQLNEDGPFGMEPDDAVEMGPTGIGQVFWSKATGELRYIWACS